MIPPYPCEYEYFRGINRLNYHKRKEAGTLKKTPSKKQDVYIYKPKNIKEAPKLEDIGNSKYLKPKKRLVKIDMFEYEKLNEIK